MKLIERFFILHLLVATTALAIAFALGGVLPAALGMAVIGAFWYYANLRNSHGLEFLLLMIYLLASEAIFYWLQSLPGWLPLLAVTAALGTWDLDYFLQRLKIVELDKINPLLGAAHLRRLGIAEGLGLLFGIAALTAHTQISFWPAVVLALLAAIGLSRIIDYLRKQNH